ncbi:MAG: HAMP domain-containing histidine kinase [Cellulosilyticum sp.]|nr:HAMP domain-containing histidine kinase [Cellulosilyticum sp.]
MEHQDRLGCRLQIRKIRNSLRFPSLFSRLVSIYISILVLMLIVLFITFTNSFQSYFVKYTQEIMINQAKGIAAEYYKAGTYSTSKEDAMQDVLEHIQMMSKCLDATAWVIDPSGNGYIVEKNKMSHISNEIILREDMNEVFSGQVISLENGFKEYFSIPVLTIGYPITIGEEIHYALLIHMPMPYILQTVDEVRNLILNVVGFVGSIVFVWIYTISRQMTKPLKEMSYAAKNIASGEFSQRIEVNGNDEIAQLGLSLNHMAEALDKIEENRRSFIANISHDLRSPLTSIQGFVTAILDGTIDAGHQERYLKIVLSESKRLINMTNTILELNQIQEGKKASNKVCLNINEMIEEATISLESRLKRKNVQVIKQLDLHNYLVLADADGLSRVIQNLLDNAFKFVGENGHIIVRSKAVQDKLWVSILNDGPAISPEQQKFIWERFYKADCSRGEDKKGVGLGLVIVKEIIKQHNESITVRSTEGEMVEFCFSMTLIP